MFYSRNHISFDSCHWGNVPLPFSGDPKITPIPLHFQLCTVSIHKQSYLKHCDFASDLLNKLPHSFYIIFKHCINCIKPSNIYYSVILEESESFFCLYFFIHLILSAKSFFLVPARVESQT